MAFETLPLEYKVIKQIATIWRPISCCSRYRQDSFKRFQTISLLHKWLNCAALKDIFDFLNDFRTIIKRFQTI